MARSGCNMTRTTIYLPVYLLNFAFHHFPLFIRYSKQSSWLARVDLGRLDRVSTNYYGSLKMKYETSLASLSLETQIGKRLTSNVSDDSWWNQVPWQGFLSPQGTADGFVRLAATLRGKSILTRISLVLQGGGMGILNTGGFDSLWGSHPSIY